MGRYSGQLEVEGCTVHFRHSTLTRIVEQTHTEAEGKDASRLSPGDWTASLWFLPRTEDFLTEGPLKCPMLCSEAPKGRFFKSIQVHTSTEILIRQDAPLQTKDLTENSQHLLSVYRTAPKLQVIDRQLQCASLCDLWSSHVDRILILNLVVILQPLA
jgi:hypothetical protein